MKTPIADFVRRYAEGGTARLHMPGHKQAQLACICPATRVTGRLAVRPLT